MTRTQADSERSQFPWLPVLLLVGVPISGSFLLMFSVLDESADWTGRGAHGDWWGGYMGAGAGLASALLLFYAVWLQHNELKHQREELQLTREEMSLARKVNETQASLMERQLRLMQQSTAREIVAALLTHRAALYANIADAGLGRMAAKRELKALDDYLLHVSGVIGVDEVEHELLLKLLEAGFFKD